MKIWSHLFRGGTRRSDQDELVDLADRERDAGNWPLASSLYQQAAMMDPVRFPIWVQCGNCAKDAGDFALAELAYNRALALGDADSDLHLQIGHLRKLQGREADALASYRRSMDLDPHGPARGEFHDLERRMQSELPPMTVPVSDAVVVSAPVVLPLHRMIAEEPDLPEAANFLFAGPASYSETDFSPHQMALLSNIRRQLNQAMDALRQLEQSARPALDEPPGSAETGRSGSQQQPSSGSFKSLDERTADILSDIKRACRAQRSSRMIGE